MLGRPACRPDRCRSAARRAAILRSSARAGDRRRPQRPPRTGFSDRARAPCQPGERILDAVERIQHGGAFGLCTRIVRPRRNHAVEARQCLGVAAEIEQRKPADEMARRVAGIEHERAVTAFDRVGEAVELRQREAAVTPHRRALQVERERAVEIGQCRRGLLPGEVRKAAIDVHVGHIRLQRECAVEAHDRAVVQARCELQRALVDPVLDRGRIERERTLVGFQRFVARAEIGERSGAIAVRLRKVGPLRDGAVEARNRLLRVAAARERHSEQVVGRGIVWRDCQRGPRGHDSFGELAALAARHGKMVQRVGVARIGPQDRVVAGDRAVEIAAPMQRDRVLQRGGRRRAHAVDWYNAASAALQCLPARRLLAECASGISGRAGEVAEWLKAAVC